MYEQQWKKLPTKLINGKEIPSWIQILSSQFKVSFKIGRFGDSIRWEEIDEDIHINSFSSAMELDTLHKYTKECIIIISSKGHGIFQKRLDVLLQTPWRFFKMP